MSAASPVTITVPTIAARRGRRTGGRGTGGRASRWRAATVALLTVAGLAAVPLPASAATPDGPVLSWGYNDSYGTLGNGTATPASAPVDVTLPAGVRIASAVFGNAHGLALTDDGTIYGWGYNKDGEVGDGSTAAGRPVPVRVDLPGGAPAVQIAAGDYFSMALTASGAVYAWGWNADGQLGNGTTSTSRKPVAVKLPAGVRAVSIEAGSNFAFAQASDGALYAWGRNDVAQLGNNSLTDRRVPVAVAMPAGVRFVAVSAGNDHTLAVSATGAVYAWGSNETRQLGLAGYSRVAAPKLVGMPGGATVAAVAAGYGYSLAISPAGRLFAWGANGYGQLGLGDTALRAAPTAVSLPAGPALAAISAGTGFSLAVRTDGSVLAWGVNWEGELGTGSAGPSSYVPVRTAIPAGVQVASVSAGQLSALAVTPLFPDVTAASLFIDDVNWLARYGITGGNAGGKFQPTAAVTRQAMAAYLYRYAHGGRNAGPCTGASPFPDVPAGSTFCGDIAWLVDQQVVAGFGDGTFRPTAPVTRQAVAAYLYRFAHDGADAGACTGSAPFRDVPAGSEFCGDIAWLASAQPVEITTGYANGTFRPGDQVSRQAMAAYLHRYFIDYYGFGAAA
ncbi:MAG TPA: S-layer homology domain-containing protein [Nakamurella sp.]|nr:S-layer homology domain-containing protein [Nakamurella sp.]